VVDYLQIVVSDSLGVFACRLNPFFALIQLYTRHLSALSLIANYEAGNAANSSRDATFLDKLAGNGRNHHCS
jgi:hypothetical protein